MAQFSAKERFIAGMLSAFPGVKQFIKKTYINLNALVYRKDYIKNIFYGNGKITTLWNGSEESFFGYYDKSPENSNGDVIVLEILPAIIPILMRSQLLSFDLATRAGDVAIKMSSATDILNSF